MSEPMPVVLPLPPGIARDQWQAWLEAVTPELISSGLGDDLPVDSEYLIRMLEFGIPEVAVGCCALLRPGIEPTLVAVYAFDDAGNPEWLAKTQVEIPGDKVLQSQDDAIDIAGLKVHRSSRIVTEESVPEEIILRGAIAVTRQIAGRTRDVSLYFMGRDIANLVAAFWPLAVFLTGELAEKLIVIGEGQ